MTRQPDEQARGEEQAGAGAAAETVQTPPGDRDGELARLRAELADLNAKYLRAVADYQNAQRRGVREQDEARRQGITAVVLSVLPVLDHFELALGLDPSKASVEQVLHGVKVIRDELMRVLEHYGVRDIAPGPDDEFDPHQHEAVTEVDSDLVRPGHIVATLQAGYALGNRVIRPARVSVARRTGAHHEGLPAGRPSSEEA